jgi:plasmid stabilization system protein ParE
MTLRVEMKRAARSELIDTRTWYEKQQAGLGEEFAEEVQKALDRIVATPDLYQRVYRDVRRGVVHRFPYSIFYRVKVVRIVVIAVFHNRRDPAIWQSRV